MSRASHNAGPVPERTDRIPTATLKKKSAAKCLARRRPTSRPVAVALEALRRLAVLVKRLRVCDEPSSTEFVDKPTEINQLECELGQHGCSTAPCLLHFGMYIDALRGA